MSVGERLKSWWERQQTPPEPREINIDWVALAQAGAFLVGAAVLGVITVAIGVAITGESYLNDDGSTNNHTLGVGLGAVLLLVLAAFAVWSLASYVWFRVKLRNHLEAHPLSKRSIFPDKPSRSDILDAIHLLNLNNEYRAMKSESRQLLWAFVVATFGFVIALGSDVFGVATALQEWLGWSS